MVGLIIALSIILALLIAMLIILPTKTWFIAIISGAHVSMKKLTGMKFRKIKMSEIVNVYILAIKSGIRLSILDLESHYLAGGNIKDVVNALISAHDAGIPLTLAKAKAIDIAGKNVVETVQAVITPKIICTENFISAIPKDGIEVKVKVKVTVKANLEKFVGSAGEDTIMARVGEGVITTIGMAESHSMVLESADVISRTIMSKGFDIGTAYEIKSVDISDIEIGENVGAKLSSAEFEKDKIMMHARAEERRLMAEAREYEMRARIQEEKSRLVAAEAEVPKAMVEAIKEGKFNVMDFYKYQNISADTAMRNAIAGEDPKKGAPGGRR